MSFKQYLADAEKSYQTEINQTLKAIPERHKSLIKGFKFEFQGGNTLKGDNEHIGLIDTKHKKIIIAAPWNYPRSFTLLHEIGHLIYAQLSDKEKEAWSKIVKKTKMKKADRQPDEELFSMGYAGTYAKNKITKFDHPEWQNFIKQLS